MIPIPLALLTSLYLGALVAANALASKLFVVFGVHVTAGALAIPLVYLTTDLINELYGRSTTARVVWMGLVANAVLLVMTLLAGWVPASPLGIDQSTFDSAFFLTPRVVIGSSVAYLVSSLLDVYLFAAIKRLTNGRWFWLRKNGSTVLSQAVDTTLFVIVAFAGAVPAGVLFAMGAGQYLVKISMAPLGTPLSYLVLAVTRRTKE